MRSFLVAVKGDKKRLELLAKCFAGKQLTIRKISDLWVIDAPTIAKAATRDDAFVIAKRLITQIHQVCTVYLNLEPPLEFTAIVWLDKNGKPCRQSIQASVIFTFREAGWGDDLSKIVAGSSFGSRLHKAICTSPSLQYAMEIAGEAPINWHRVYDIIEFVGNENVIAHEKWATRAEVRLVRQTANHYRHLGNPRKTPLPPDAPDLRKATYFALDLLKRWILRELKTKQ